MHTRKLSPLVVLIPSILSLTIGAASAQNRGTANDDPLRRALGDVDRDITVEVGCGKQQFAWCAVGQMSDRGGDDVATPAVLYGHGDAQLHAQVTGLPQPG